MEPNKIYIAHDIGKTELTPEQAKELLKEELPPNMKKIIEGGSKEMSNVEDLQIEHEKDLLALEQEIEGWKSANRILKIKLDIAEKALERIAYQTLDDGSHAMTALQKLRS